jgi:hypothetical protein
MKLRMIAIVLILALAAWLPAVAQQGKGSQTAPSTDTAGSACDCCDHKNHASDSGKSCCQGKDGKAMACCREHAKSDQSAMNCCEGKDGKGCCSGKDGKPCCGKDALACSTKDGKNCCQDMNHCSGCASKSRSSPGKRASVHHQEIQRVCLDVQTENAHQFLFQAFQFQFTGVLFTCTVVQGVFQQSQIRPQLHLPQR